MAERGTRVGRGSPRGHMVKEEDHYHGVPRHVAINQNSHFS